jgi:CheY-like chemotaxis protein
VVEVCGEPSARYSENAVYSLWGKAWLGLGLRPILRCSRAGRDVSAVTFQDKSPAVEGQSVLILEDQVLIALHMEDMLLDLGASACWMVSANAEALQLLETQSPNLALLDFNLGDETSEKTADRLMELAVPFVFFTGYGDGLVIADRFFGTPIAGKPVTKSTLIGKIKAAQDRFR